MVYSTDDQMSLKCHHQHEFVLLEQLLILDSFSQLVSIIFFVRILFLLQVIVTATFRRSGLRILWRLQLLCYLTRIVSSFVFSIFKEVFDVLFANETSEFINA